MNSATNTLKSHQSIEPGTPHQGWRGIDLALMTALSLTMFFGLLIALTVALMLTSGSDVSDPTVIQQLTTSLPFVIATGISTFIALVGSIALASMWRRRTIADLGLRPLNRRMVLITLAAACGLRIFTIPLGYLLQVLGFPMDNPQLSFLAPEGFRLGALLPILLIIGILIPFAEELFFRGVLFTWLRDRWGIWVGTTVSALVFGAVHGHPTIGVVAFFLGIATAIAYQRSGSLWTSILLHGVFNTLALLILYGMLAAGIQIPGM